MVTRTSEKTPSLGIEEDSTISVHEGALIQLNDSIRLFVAGSYLSSVTLAGAADELLGKLLSKQGGQSAIHESLDSI